jgi:3-dehydroquinate dehydratase type I
MPLRTVLSLLERDPVLVPPLVNHYASRVTLCEIRVDPWDDARDVSRVLDGVKTPVIVTCRHHDEGGWRDHHRKREKALRRAVSDGVAFVDVEARFPVRLPRGDGSFTGHSPTRVITSWHDYDGMPPEIDTLAAKLVAERERDDDLVKLAVTPQTWDDVLALKRIAEAYPDQVIVLAMGRYGVAQRVLACSWGSFETYLSPAVGADAAAGQIPLASWENTYAHRVASGVKHVFATVGEPIDGSLSPALHNAFLEAQVMLRSVMVPIPAAEPIDPAAARETGIDGFTVTAPLKQLMADAYGGSGPANSIAFDGQSWRAMNTDPPALHADLVSLCGPLADHTVAFVGGGAVPAAQAAWWTANGNGPAAIEVWLRDGSPRTIVGASTERIGSRGSSSAAVVIQTTPVGYTDPGESIRDLWRHFPRARFAYEIHYRHARTAFTTEAASHGCATATGAGMFAAQAARQFAFFVSAVLPKEPHAATATAEAIEPAARQAVSAYVARASRSIALVGPRASGKSTVGRLLAQRLGRGFVDTDDEVERRESQSIPGIFATRGESVFREIESAVLADIDLSPRGGKVIATGGGVVLSEANRVKLRDAVVVSLECPLELLIARLRQDEESGRRPALTRMPLEDEVWETVTRRIALYRSVAHVVVRGVGRDGVEKTPAVIVDEIIAALRGNPALLWPAP